MLSLISILQALMFRKSQAAQAGSMSQTSSISSQSTSGYSFFSSSYLFSTSPEQAIRLFNIHPQTPSRLRSCLQPHRMQHTAPLLQTLHHTNHIQTPRKQAYDLAHHL